jgi:CBS domain-containing protein
VESAVAHGPAIAAGATVTDVMPSSPKTLPATASVKEVRGFLNDEHVAMALLTDGPTFRAAITEIPMDAPLDALAVLFADPAPGTIAPAESAATAFRRAAATPHRRLIVLDDDGLTLLGLVCVSSDRRRFCKHAGVQR